MRGRATLRIEKSTASVKLAVSRTTRARRSRPGKRDGWGEIVTMADMESFTDRRGSVDSHAGFATSVQPDTARSYPPQGQATPARNLENHVMTTITGTAPASELGEFLRTRRDALSPEAAGIVSYGMRRVPGLRREELAQLAGVSVAYYTRLEQGQSIAASDSILDALARALQLRDDERTHLFELARPRP